MFGMEGKRRLTIVGMVLCVSSGFQRFPGGYEIEIE